MVNKREWRMEMAKRLLKADPGASAEQIARTIAGLERNRRPQPLQPVSKFLGGFKCRTK